MSEIRVLQNSLHRVMDGEAPLPGWANPRFGMGEPYGAVGSDNWQLMQRSVELWLRGDEETIAWWERTLRDGLGLPDGHGHRGWMAREPFSTIYDGTHLGPVCSVWGWTQGKESSAGLRELAQRWLDVRWLAGDLTSLRGVAPRNQFFEGIYARRGVGWASCWGGARSFQRSGKGSTGDPQWLDTPPRSTWLMPYVHRKGTRLPESGYLVGILRRIPRLPEPRKVMESPGIRGSVRIRRYEGGVCMWAEDMTGWSSATAPIEATVVYADGRAEYLASNDGSRHHVVMGRAPEIGVEGDLLWTEGGIKGSLFGWQAGKDIGIDLPEGALLRDWRWDAGGLKQLPGD